MIDLPKKGDIVTAWQKSLGEPVVFIPFPGHKPHGIGYFKQGDGVVSVRKLSDGYDPNTVLLYSSAIIDLLVRVRDS